MRPLGTPALVYLLLTLAFCASAPCQQAPTIGELVADLGHPVFAVREKAQRDLWNRADEAIPSLEKALTDENPEIVRRARELLDKFSWGVRPTTPPEVLLVLRRFQVGDKDPQKNAELRKSSVLELLKLGPKGVSVARALLGKGFTAEVREQLVAQATALLRREVPLRLFEGKTDEAAELMELHTAGTSSEGAGDYAVFQMLSRKLPAATVSAETTAKIRKQTANEKLILTHLYRASEDWQKARAAAADLPVPPDRVNPVELLREDEGDWGALADTVAFGAVNHPDAVRLSYLRLAGRKKEFDEIARGIVTAANEFSTSEEVFEAAVALFANHRADEATKILFDRKQNLGLLGEVLIARLRYKEALGLFDDQDARKSLPVGERLACDLRRARVLMLTGNREDAVQLFNQVAEGLRKRSSDGSDSFSLITSVRSLLRAEMRVALKELASEHAAEFLAAGTFQRFDRTAGGESAFEILFGQNATSGETLFTALRASKIPGNRPGPTMTRVRELLSGKASKAAVDEALKALGEAAPDEETFSTEGRLPKGFPLAAGPGESKSYQAKRFLAIAAVSRAAGRDAAADAAFKQATELTSEAADVAGARTWAYGVSDAFRPYVEWGEFLYDRERYQESATRLLDGWKRFPDQPLLLFLSGKSLMKAGDAKEGNRRIVLSHWVALGQERIRGKFLDELVRRGEATAAKREIELVQRGCWFRDHYFGNVMNQASQAAALNRDFETAEKCRQRSLLVILKTPDVYFVETSSYMTVPHDLLVYRARARLAAGKVDEAMAIAREILAVTPGHVDLVSGMVPELDLLGKKAEADELFGVVWSAYQQVLADFPNSASARNSLAALSANCRRELDNGLSYATAAVKAEPASLPFRETLAEVCFRKGEREKALEVMTKLVEEDPRNRLYKRQLVRYRSGPLDSPKPDRED